MSILAGVGAFASCAQVYRNLSSRFDYDAAYYMGSKNNYLGEITGMIDKLQAKNKQKAFKWGEKHRVPFPLGYF